MPIDYNKIFEVSDSYQAPSKLMEILFDKEKLFLHSITNPNIILRLLKNYLTEQFHSYF